MFEIQIGIQAIADELVQMCHEGRKVDAVKEIYVENVVSIIEAKDVPNCVSTGRRL